MRRLTRHFDRLNARYQGAEGDRFAIEELAPVANRFIPDGGCTLEIGCGYGRNLVALAAGRAGFVVGCDPQFDELTRARDGRIARLGPDAPTTTVVQQEPYRLPFRDGTFDLVVCWQVLEHLFGPEAKPRVLAECVRVLRPGGHLLIETPNQWFPFDYHDNKLPLVHWILPSGAREWLTWKVRGMRYPPSEYVSLPALERLLRGTAGVRGIEKVTRIYFASSFGEAWRRLGGTQVRLKRLLLVLLAPVHALIAPFGGSADLFLPSLRVVWRIEK